MLNDAEKYLIEALRSGRYKQGQNRLREEGDKFCCLGVACDTSGLGEWHGLHYDITEGDDFHSVFLPEAVRQKLGWRDIDGPLVFSGCDDEHLTLVRLNDTGFTFDQIADVIEAGLIVKSE